MSETSDIQNSVERMKQHGAAWVRPNTVSTFTRGARGFLAHVGKLPAEITSDDIEGFLLELARRDVPAA